MAAGAARTCSLVAASISSILCGSVFISAISSASRSGVSFPRASAIHRPSRYMAATWLVKVFVAATPISSPARVRSTESASRVAWLPCMLVSATTCAPRSRASRIAASVSAVSPDCVMPITRSSGPTRDRGSGTRRRRPSRPARGPVLDRVATDEAGVVGGAAGDDDHPPQVRRPLGGERDLGEVDRVSVRQAVDASRRPRRAARRSP